MKMIIALTLLFWLALAKFLFSLSDRFGWTDFVILAFILACFVVLRIEDTAVEVPPTEDI